MPSYWRNAMVLLVVASSVAHGQPCDKFIVMDNYSSSTDYRIFERTKDTLCSKEVRDKSSATEAGVKAGIPIPVLEEVFSLTLGASYKSNDWEHWSKEFCHAQYYELQSQLSQRNLTQVFSENARRAVSDCLRSEPVYAYFDVSQNADAFTFTFTVQGKDKLKTGSLVSNNAVNECTSPIDNPFALSWFERTLWDADISGTKRSVSCRWDSNKTVLIGINLANQGQRSYRLDAIVKRQAPPPPPETGVAVEEYPTDWVNSGACKDWGQFASVSTPTKQNGWVVVDHSFSLVGDRQCGAWAQCVAEVVNAKQGKYKFQTQGHAEECGHAGNTGIHPSKGILKVVWRYPK